MKFWKHRSTHHQHFLKFNLMQNNLVFGSWLIILIIWYAWYVSISFNSIHFVNNTFYSFTFWLYVNRIFGTLQWFHTWKQAKIMYARSTKKKQNSTQSEIRSSNVRFSLNMQIYSNTFASTSFILWFCFCVYPIHATYSIVSRISISDFSSI